MRMLFSHLCLSSNGFSLSRALAFELRSTVLGSRERKSILASAKVREYPNINVFREQGEQCVGDTLHGCKWATGHGSCAVSTTSEFDVQVE